MSAGEPMAHHVLTPWTLGEDGAATRLDTGVRFTLATEPCRVLVDADPLDPRVPPGWWDDLFALAAMGPRVTWLLWTRRPGSWRRLIGASDVPANVWLGVRASTQAECDARIPELLRIPAALRWLWLDPLAGAVDLSQWLGGEWCECYGSDHERGTWDPHLLADHGNHLRWVVAQGGESPVHPAWVRSLRDQCSEAGVPFRFGGWGEWGTGEECGAEPTAGVLPCGRVIRDGEELWLAESLTACPIARVGAEASGRLLDWRTHDDVPESREVPRG